MNFWEYLDKRAIRNLHPDVIISRTQRNVTYLLYLCVVALVVLLIFLPKPLDETVKVILTGAFSALVAVLTMQATFWYGRPRASGIPNPETTTTETQITQRTVPTKPSEEEESR